MPVAKDSTAMAPAVGLDFAPMLHLVAIGTNPRRITDFLACEEESNIKDASN
jgi:hypothetical protein